MKIQMLVGMSGTRSGEAWPPYMGVMDVDDEEGAQLCAGGLARPVFDDKVEHAAAPEPERRGGLTTASMTTPTSTTLPTSLPEKRGPGRPRKNGTG